MLCIAAARDMIFRLIDEHVPSVAAVIDDVVEGFENSVRQPVLSPELPDILLAVEFGRAWRSCKSEMFARNLEGLGAMPASLIEEKNSVSARSNFGCDLIEVKLGSTRVAPRSPVPWQNPLSLPSYISRIIHRSRPAGVKQMTAA